MEKDDLYLFYGRQRNSTMFTTLSESFQIPFEFLGDSMQYQLLEYASQLLVGKSKGPDKFIKQVFNVSPFDVGVIHRTNGQVTLGAHVDVEMITLEKGSVWEGVLEKGTTQGMILRIEEYAKCFVKTGYVVGQTSYMVKIVSTQGEAVGVSCVGVIDTTPVPRAILTLE